jgi:phosphatidylinositol glycan class C protein
MSQSISSTQSNEPWQRILWKRQNYPDNYTPANEFLSRLSIQAIEQSKYSDLVIDSLNIASRIAVLSLFACHAYWMLRIASDKDTNDSQMTFASIINRLVLPFVVLLCSTFSQAIDHGRAIKQSVKESMKQAINDTISLIICLLFFSPILSSLTVAWSSDTIYSLAVVMSIIHLLTYDYAFVDHIEDVSSNRSARSGPGLSSTNASLTLATLLASRLSSAVDCFILLSEAAYLFAILPMIQRQIRLKSLRRHCHFCMMLIGLGLMSLSLISWNMCLTGLGVLLLVVIICPAYFQYAQKDKQVMSGPWDYDDEPENRPENL